MLKLNASYSKKVPAESEYSSQSYHCTIEVELPDGLTSQQLQEKVHGVFAFVRSSVESELHSSARTDGQLQGAPATAQIQSDGYPQQQPQQPCPQPNGGQYRKSPALASPKQINYLLSLTKRAGWTFQQVLQRCQVNSVEQIPARLCSQLINELSGQAA